MLSAQLAALSALLFGAAVLDGRTAPILWLRLLAACSMAYADLALGLLFFGVR